MAAKHNAVSSVMTERPIWISWNCGSETKKKPKKNMWGAWLCMVSERSGVAGGGINDMTMRDRQYQFGGAPAFFSSYFLRRALYLWYCFYFYFYFSVNKCSRMLM